jgi:hypothetical protein
MTVSASTHVAVHCAGHAHAGRVAPVIGVMQRQPGPVPWLFGYQSRTSGCKPPNPEATLVRFPPRSFTRTRFYAEYDPKKRRYVTGKAQCRECGRRLPVGFSQLVALAESAERAGQTEIVA